ncbi:MAG: acylneuraminate cytidylyltransferase family protein [Alphaproteobacteria bacterium]
MRAIGLICARGGSKGVPGKNIRPLAGKPLIAWAIEQARAVPRLERVLVSTDSEEIAAIARQWGAETPFLRPAELAQDDSPEWLVWQHALFFLKSEGGRLPDALVVVPATSPLRAPEDVERCLDEFARRQADIVITVCPAHNNPWFNMVKETASGHVELVIPPEGEIVRRQDAPQVFNITTVAYVADPKFVFAHGGIFEGRVRAVHIPPERALDIDTMMDFRFAELLMAQSGQS